MTTAAFRRMRRAALPRSTLRFVAPLTVLAGWEVAARFGLINILLLPPPSKAFADLIVLVSSGYLWKALYARNRRS